MTGELVRFVCPVCGQPGPGEVMASAVIVCKHNDRARMRPRHPAVMVAVTPLPLTDAKENA